MATSEAIPFKLKIPVFMCYKEGGPFAGFSPKPLPDLPSNLLPHAMIAFPHQVVIS